MLLQGIPLDALALVGNLEQRILIKGRIIVRHRRKTWCLRCRQVHNRTRAG
jgi:hypothetical protein